MGSRVGPLSVSINVEVNDMSLKILIVDDDPVSLRVMRSLIVSLGHTVLTFEDKLEAEERAECQRFDVVFLGMRLPELYGLEVARFVRNTEMNRESTIVMLNATDDIESLRMAFSEGADFVLTKPLTAARILPMLAAMESPGWKGKRHAARLPLFTDVVCKSNGREFRLRSMNISQSGMLLQPSIEGKIGEEVALEFKIAEFRASLDVRARITRKEGTDRVGMEFVNLAPEDINAIQLYVLGRMMKPQLSHERGTSRNIWMEQGFFAES